MPTPLALARARRGSPSLLPAARPTLGVALLLSALLAPLAAGCGRATVREGDNRFECEDGADNDADGQADCADPGCGAAALCQDGDGDGVPAADDCDDADPEVRPGAAERPRDGRGDGRAHARVGNGRRRLHA